MELRCQTVLGIPSEQRWKVQHGLGHAEHRFPAFLRKTKTLAGLLLQTFRSAIQTLYVSCEKAKRINRYRIGPDTFPVVNRCMVSKGHCIPGKPLSISELKYPKNILTLASPYVIISRNFKRNG